MKAIVVSGERAAMWMARDHSLDSGLSTSALIEVPMSLHVSYHSMGPRLEEHIEFLRETGLDWAAVKFGGGSPNEAFLMEHNYMTQKL